MEKMYFSAQFCNSLTSDESNSDSAFVDFFPCTVEVRSRKDSKNIENIVRDTFIKFLFIC